MNYASPIVKVKKHSKKLFINEKSHNLLSGRTTEDENSRVNKYIRSCEKRTILPEYVTFSPVLQSRIEYINEEKNSPKVKEIKERFKKYKINKNLKICNMKENLIATAKMIMDYDTLKKNVRVKSHNYRNKLNIPSNIFIETKSNYIKINRNNLGPRLGNV